MSLIIQNGVPKSGMPVLLTDNVVLDFTITAGQTKQLSSQKMSNIYGCAMAIDEIIFYVLPSPVSSSDSADFRTAVDFGALITANMRVGNLKLMANPVHLRSLCTRVQDQLSYPAQRASNAGLAVTCYASTFYRWKLADPLYIGRSGSLDVTLAADPVASQPFSIAASVATKLRVYVAAIGRLVPEVQHSEQAYPYVAEFAPKLSYTASGGYAKFAMANNPTFLNPFYQPLRIQRLVASLYTVQPFGDESNSLIGDLYVDALSVYPDIVNVKVWDSKGNNIAGYGGASAIPLGALVDPRTGDWQVERNLDAGQWLNVEMYAVNPLAPATLDVGYVSPRLAMVASQMAQFVP